MTVGKHVLTGFQWRAKAVAMATCNQGNRCQQQAYFGAARKHFYPEKTKDIVQRVFRTG